MVTSIEVAWAVVDPWAPNQFTNPSRIYDNGIYVRYQQQFLWDQAHVNELHSVTGSNGKYRHEFLRDKDKWDAMNWLCQHYASRSRKKVLVHLHCKPKQSMLTTGMTRVQMITVS